MHSLHCHDIQALFGRDSRQGNEFLMHTIEDYYEHQLKREKNDLLLSYSIIHFVSCFLTILEKNMESKSFFHKHVLFQCIYS